MLRTTRRNRDLASRKTLKRQVYAQKGGALWFTLENDIGNTRLNMWTSVIEAAVTKGTLPESLNNLTKPDATPQQQLDAFIACHQYQDTLLNMSIHIAKKQLNIPEDLNIQIVAANITKVTASFDNMVGIYAHDVLSFLNLETNETPKTDKITYITSGLSQRKNIILEPRIFKNMFIDSLANIFIAAKNNTSDINFLKSKMGDSNLRNIVRLFGMNWKNYTDKQSVEYTGTYLTGSFFLAQPYDEFKKILEPDNSSTFFEEFAYGIISKTNAIKINECKNYEYGNALELWVKLTSDLFNTYVATPRIGIIEIIKYFDINNYTEKDCKGMSGLEVDALFAPNDSIDLPILGTTITIHTLLLQIDKELLSFMMHLLQVINENEILLMKQIEASGDAGKLAEFKTKFGRT
jgi:hypothetical protein